MPSASAYLVPQGLRKLSLSPPPSFSPTPTPWQLQVNSITLLLTQWNLRSPLSLITPAKSHPQVVVQAISARNRQRAEEFAKKHGIPDVRDSYQGTFSVVTRLVHICMLTLSPS